MSPAPRDRTLAQQLSRAFAFFGVIVAAAFFITALTYSVSRIWLTPEFERSRLAVSAESAAQAAMLDEENGLHAYLLTRDVHFMGPYIHAEVALARANKALVEYAGSVPEVAAAMLGTRLAEETWHERWANAASDTRLDVVAPSMSEGKALFDAYRTEEAAFAGALNQRSELLSRREHRAIDLRVAVELTVFVIVCFLAVLQHRAVRDSVVVPIAALLSHVGRVRDGQLEATVDPAGARELRQLGEGLNEMVRALSMARQAAESRDETLRERSVQLRQILEASREFSESLNLKYVVGAVRTSTAAVGGYERVIVWLMDDEQRQLVDADGNAAILSSNGAVEMGKGLAGRAAKSGRTTVEGPAGEVRFGDSHTGPVRAIAIPLIVGARVVGALEARLAEARVLPTHAIEVVEMLATHAATFVMLDVDHFKAFNDTHGHPKADTALQEVAEVIAGCVRTTDTAYRYGGEEFCILLRAHRHCRQTRCGQAMRSLRPTWRNQRGGGVAASTWQIQ